MKIIIFKTLALIFSILFSLNLNAKVFESDLKNTSRFEIKIAPVAFSAKWTTLDISYRLTENFAFGPSLILYSAGSTASMFTPTYQGTAYGAHAYYYLNPVSSQTTYISVHLYDENYKSYSHGSNAVDDLDGYKINSAYGLFYRSHSFTAMTFHLGLGLEYRNYSSTKTEINTTTQITTITEDTKSYFLPFVEFKVGVEF